MEPVLLVLDPSLILTEINLLVKTNEDPYSRNVEKSCVHECKRIFAESTPWDFRRLYIIFMIASRSKALREEIVKINRDTKWGLLFQGTRVTDTIEKHLAFGLTPSDTVNSLLNLLFIL